jgi:hypothetical protein
MAREPFASKLTSIWIGGFFFWIIKGFNGKFTDQIVQKYQNRNIWVGYIISFIALIIAIYLFFLRS